MDESLKLVDKLTIFALIFGPIAAVLITLWHQDRKQKSDAKIRLFMSMMAHRRIYPPTGDWVNSLNLIDVVFADHPKVLAAWQTLYDYLHTDPMDMRLYNQKTLTLLSEIATVLNYKTLKQVDIDKFYSPIAHGAQAKINDDIQTEWLRVLKETQSLSRTEKPQS